MNTKKLLLLCTCSLLLLSTGSFAAKPEWAEKDKEKVKKEKAIPYGLQKKVQRDGELPAGWKKKIKKGEVVDYTVLSKGRILKSFEYPYVKGTKVYEIEDKIIRVSNATKEILDILK